MRFILISYPLKAAWRHVWARIEERFVQPERRIERLETQLRELSSTRRELSKQVSEQNLRLVALDRLVHRADEVENMLDTLPALVARLAASEKRP